MSDFSGPIYPAKSGKISTIDCLNEQIHADYQPEYKAAITRPVLARVVNDLEHGVQLLDALQETRNRIFELENTQREAAARIEQLEAENARLREALKPFAASKRVFGDKAEPGMPDGHAYNLVWNMDEGRCDFTLGQFRRARAALAGKAGT